MQIIDKLAWIYVKDKKILMTRTRGKDVWYLPGGKRMAGESDQDALFREIKEELNIELIPGSIHYLAVFKAQADGKPEGVEVQITCYTGDFHGDIQPSSEIEEITWLDSTVEPHLITPATLQLFPFLKEKQLIH
jgi:8-oxo-dGTP diphosphatase